MHCGLASVEEAVILSNAFCSWFLISAAIVMIAQVVCSSFSRQGQQKRRSSGASCASNSQFWMAAGFGYNVCSRRPPSDELNPCSEGACQFNRHSSYPISCCRSIMRAKTFQLYRSKSVLKLELGASKSLSVLLAEPSTNRIGVGGLLRDSMLIETGYLLGTF